MALKRTAIALVCLIIFICAPPRALAGRKHEVLFPNTDYELRVYRVFGREKGKTLMIIGGIQGDEPGGYLTADLYADLELKKGNLIVVPRANLFSILLNKRGARGDMNRMFDLKGPRTSEARVVEVLKGLIAESDCLLNLHEGTGFYSPRWQSPLVNPKRYGQSIIVDASVYRVPGSPRVIELKKLALRVTENVNRHIEEPRYRFRFNNHKTLDQDTIHPEQRKSATFYALTRAHIPAFGIETSKSISDLEIKIRHHRLVVNNFMEELGIIPENPAILLIPPRLEYLVVTVNGSTPVVLTNRSTLYLETGDRLVVSHAETNYKRGVYVDILGVGNQNDAEKPFVIQRSTRITVRKDKWPCGWVELKVVADKRGPVPRANSLIVAVNGRDRVINNGESLPIMKGDALKIVRALSDRPELDVEIKVNFKGFVPKGKLNLGDDRGFRIDTAHRLLARFSKSKRGRRYPIVASFGDIEVGRFWVLIHDPALSYLVVKEGEQRLVACPAGGEVGLTRGKRCRVVGFKANFDEGPLTYLVRGKEADLDSPFTPEELAGPGRARVEVVRRGLQVGAFFIKVLPRPFGLRTGMAADSM